jgi:hypothetical protein
MPQSTAGSPSIIAVCTVAAALGVGLVWATEPQSAHYQWNNVTVGGGGFSPNIVFSPVEQGLAYLRTDIGGLYRYDQSQQRWIPLQDGMSEGNYFGVESVVAARVLQSFAAVDCPHTRAQSNQRERTLAAARDAGEGSRCVVGVPQGPLPLG